MLNGLSNTAGDTYTRADDLAPAETSYTGNWAIDNRKLYHYGTNMKAWEI